MSIYIHKEINIFNNNNNYYYHYYYTVCFICFCFNIAINLRLGVNVLRKRSDLVTSNICSYTGL